MTCTELVGKQQFQEPRVLYFSTCQVRVVRFYVSCRPPPPPPRPPAPPRPPPPDLNRELRMAVFPAGPQPRVCSAVFPAGPQAPQHAITSTRPETQPQAQ